MRVLPLACLVFSAWALSAPFAAKAAGLPPIRSAQDALIQLSLKGEGKRLAALGNLATACRGRLRLSLRDNSGVLGRLKAMSLKGSAKVKRAVMDCARCATPPKFAALVTVQLSDSNPAVVAYAAEAAGGVGHGALLGPLAEAWSNKHAACLKDGLSAVHIDACVWLTYAPGAVIERGGVTGEPAAKAAGLAAGLFASPYPKVREVAVETVAASKLEAHAPALKAMIAREKKKGGFVRPNDRALLGRFSKRLRVLTRK